MKESVGIDYLGVRIALSKSGEPTAEFGACGEEGREHVLMRLQSNPNPQGSRSCLTLYEKLPDKENS